MGEDNTNLLISKPLTLPCGLTLPNRIGKAALAEGWANADRLPSERLQETYGVWARGGWGLILTGNVQVDVTYLGTSQDNAFNRLIPRQRLLDSWRRWAEVTGGNGTPVIMQINHPGRQSVIGAGTRSICAKSIAPSAKPLLLGNGLIARAISSIVFGTPRAMTIEEIRNVISYFAECAVLAAEAGFAGAQIHGAHGYLLAQFLSAHSNQREDAYGGCPRRRARIVVEIVEEIRKRVPETFAIGLKFNSVDHQSQHELRECIDQLDDITAAGIDFLEISGGTYENPTMMATEPSKTASTATREAFFLDFARAIRDRFRDVPLMVTGGFRTRQGMEDALRGNACDIIGVGRPSVLYPMLPTNVLFNEEIRDNDAVAYASNVPGSWFFKKLGIKGIAGGAETNWYRKQIHNISSSL